jgi:hypothetical protein
MKKNIIKKIGCASLAVLMCTVGACSESKKSLSTECKNYADGQFYTGPENLTGKECNANNFDKYSGCTYSTGKLRRASPQEEADTSWKISTTGEKVCGEGATLQYACNPERICERDSGYCYGDVNTHCTGIPDRM